MICEHCREPIPEYARRDTRFCSTKCRMAFMRARRAGAVAVQGDLSVTRQSGGGYSAVTDNSAPSKPGSSQPMDWKRVEELIASFPADGGIPEFLRRNPDNSGGAKDWKKSHG